MKIEMVLKPCPWCRKTPEIFMPIPENETWRWTIQCCHASCKMKPKTPHVSIRNTSKTEFLRFIRKLEELADNWNIGNPFKATQMKVIDCEKIEKPDNGWSMGSLDPYFTRINAMDSK